MQFRLDTRKAIEAAATLLRLNRYRCMDRKRLLALLYIADRESIKRAGRPIIGGRLVAMDHGPIHSDVYDFIKGGHWEQPKWSKHFANDGYVVQLTDEPEITSLSRFEVDLLDEVTQDNAKHGTWDLAESTHYEEWKKNHSPKTSTKIRLEDVLDAVGRGKDKDAIARTAEDIQFFDKLFGEVP